MVKMNVYGPDGQIIDSTELSEQPPLNDPNCVHPPKDVITVDDPMPGVVAKQCRICGIGWLIRVQPENSKNQGES